MNDQPIFLLGSHKSGTSLLRSIFDGHPDLFVVPFESHYFQNMSYWVDYNYRMQSPSKLDKKEILDRFTGFLKHIDNSDDRMGDSPIRLDLDIETFREVFQKVDTGMSDRDRFELYMDAIHRCLNHEPLPQSRRVVEKSVEHAEYAAFLQEMFPKASFVHIIRNPYATAVSLRRYKAKQGKFPLANRLFETLYNSYYYLYRNPLIIDNYHVLRYENLVTDSAQEVQRLADFLDLSFRHSMLKPTKEGQSWTGNSISEEKLKGFDATRVDAWHNEISAMEIRFVNELFPFVLDDFGYTPLPTPSLGSFLLPVRSEGLLRYLVNRCYLGYLSYRPGQ